MTIDEIAATSTGVRESVEPAPGDQPKTRTSQSAAGRPKPPARKKDSSGPPLRAFAMVLIALGIVFAGLGLREATTPAGESPTTPATTATAAAAAKPSPKPAPATASQMKAVGVRVLNNSNVAGLAGKTAKQLTSDGWKVVETGNYSDATIKRSVAYYGTAAAEKQAALQIADELGVAAAKKPAGGKFGAGVVVVLVG